MVYKGYKRPLTTKDMWILSEKNTTSDILQKFDSVYLPQVEKAINTNCFGEGKNAEFEVGILSAIVKTFWPGLLFVGFLRFIASFLKFVNPLVLDQLIGFISNSREPMWRGYFYASLMLISPMIESLFNSQYEFIVNGICMRVRACLISTIYRKVY